ncbi:hypothetical protein D7Y21_16090 [Corallococcus sp. AB045]|nr:hypothetical protein D7Y21_16090 [Corallococcus sp. AB045]
MLSLALNTGLRIGELAALSWDRVDLASRRLLVKRNVYLSHLCSPEGGHEREVPLNEWAPKVLREYPRRIDSPWVFPQRDGGFIHHPQHTCAEAILRNATRASDPSGVKRWATTPSPATSLCAECLSRPSRN